MKKGLRIGLRIAAGAAGAAVLLALVAFLLLLFDKPLVRRIARGRLVKMAGPAARFDRLDYSVFPLRVTVEGLVAGREDAFQKLELKAARLDLTGSVVKLVRGVKPAFDSIAADGLVLRLEQKAASEEPFDVEALLLQAADALAWAGRVSLKGSRLTFDFLPSVIDIDRLDLALTPEERGAIVGYAIGGAAITVRGKDGGFALSTGLASSGRLGLITPFQVDSEFALLAPRLRMAGVEDAVASLDLALTGRFERFSGELTVSRLSLTVPGLFTLDGTGSGIAGRHVFVEAKAAAHFEDLAAAAALLRPRLPEAFRDSKLTGRADLKGRYVLQRSSPDSHEDLEASLSLDDVSLEHRLDGRLIRLRAGGRIDASGPPGDPRLDVDLRASLGPLALSGLSVSGAGLRLAASGTLSAADVASFEATLSDLAVAAAEGRSLSFGRATVTGSGRVDLGSLAVSRASVVARFPGLAPIRLSGRYGFGPGAAADLRLESRDLDIAALRGLAAPFVPAALAGWDLAGTAGFSLAARRPAGRGAGWSASGTLALTGARFNDPAFTVAGEGLDPVFTFEASPAAGSPVLSVTGGLALGKGESLWKSVYVSWERHPLALSFSGRHDPRAGAVEGLTARFDLAAIGTVDVAGSARTAPALSFDLRTEARLGLGPLYSLYAQTGVAEEARLKLEGSLGASFRLLKDGPSLTAGGRLTIVDAAIENPASKSLFLGLSADIPVSYDSAPAASDGSLPDRGFLRLGEFQSPGLTLKSIDIPLRSGLNALSLEPFGIDLYGGRLELGRTTFRLDPATGSFRGLGSLALRELDIARLPVASPQFRLTGKFRAEFPVLDIAADRVGVSGRGEADVFGGQIVLRDFAVARPFAAGRTISLNVDFVDLDLKKLTDEVPFGEVTGIVRGEVRDLVISYMQPERFTFRLESVPRKGVAQTFSLKAVDNLTVLSSGQQASSGSGGFWMRFIRGFRYEKLGILSTLRNDTFTLNGTIREGGIEYLVKKPALFGISVVNREPDKVISFKEMTSRLKRVGQSDK